MRRRLLLSLLVALLALPLAACGGGGGGGNGSSATTSGEGGAAIVPKTAPLLVRLDTTFDSPQWATLNTLLKKFPDGDKLLSGIAGPGVDFEQDVNPALGPETDHFALNGADLQNKVFLGATQPDDQAKFQSLLDKDKDKPVTEQIGGWQVIADRRETIDRYKIARRAGVRRDHTAASCLAGCTEWDFAASRALARPKGDGARPCRSRSGGEDELRALAAAAARG